MAEFESTSDEFEGDLDDKIHEEEHRKLVSEAIDIAHEMMLMDKKKAVTEAIRIELNVGMGKQVSQRQQAFAIAVLSMV